MMTSQRVVTSFPATDDGEPLSERRRTRRAEVPTSLRVTGVMDPPRNWTASSVQAEDVERQPPAAGDDLSSRSGSEAAGSEAAEEDSSSSSSSGAAGSESPLTLDLPDCFDVPSRAREGSRVLNSARYRRLVHPLDRGMLLSFAASVVYLAAALAAVCPTLLLVCAVLPLAVVARRVVTWCCGGGAPAEAYDDFGMRMFDAQPLSGHEEFWVAQPLPSDRTPRVHSVAAHPRTTRVRSAWT